MADFCVGLSLIPSLFFCDITNTCLWPYDWSSWASIIRWLFGLSSVVNLCLLVLDRFIAIVYPLKYITLMTRRRITQAIFFSWVLTVCYKVINFTLFYVLYQSNSYPFSIWLTIFSEILPCVILPTLLSINDISCMQAWSVSTHLSKTVTF